MPHLPLVVIPDPEDAGCADITVQGRVANRSYQFILDSGSGRTLVPYDEFSAAFPRTGSHVSHAVFEAGDDDVIRVPEVSAGPMRRGPLEIIRAGRLYSGARALIGMDILQYYRCHLDFDKNILEIDEDRGRPPTLPLHLDNAGHPYADVTLSNVTAHSVWDTGAGITVVDVGFLMRNVRDFQEVQSTFGTDATGSRVETRTFIMLGPKIGGYRFPAHRVAAVDLSNANESLETPMDMILGYTTLRQANWLMDFPAKRWAVTRPPRTLEPAGATGDADPVK